MKKVLIVLIALLFAPFVWSQESTDNATSPELSLDNLEVPNTPAFILLDEAPTSIQRPNSTRAFALDVLQDVSDDGVLENIAVEVTPFWMVPHVNMSPEKYLGIKKTDDGSVKQNIFSKLRLVSISAAYIKSSDSITNMSFGARATLFELKRKEDVDAYVHALSRSREYLNNSANYLEEFNKNICKIPKPEDYDNEAEFEQALTTHKNKCKPENAPQPPAIGATPQQIQAFKAARKDYFQSCICPPERRNYDTQAEFDAAKEWYESGLNKYREQRRKEDAFTATELNNIYNELSQRKPLLALDIAAAYNHRFFSQEFNDNGAGRFGVWSTFTLSSYLSQNKKTDYLNIYAFFRYLDETNRGMVPVGMDDRFNAFDIGIKGELEFNKLAVGYEYINRTGDMEGYRSAGTIRYQLLNDVFLTGSFGNNFSETDDLISLFGIKWGINSKLQAIDIGNTD